MPQSDPYPLPPRDELRRLYLQAIMEQKYGKQFSPLSNTDRVKQLNSQIQASRAHGDSGYPMSGQLLDITLAQLDDDRKRLNADLSDTSLEADEFKRANQKFGNEYIPEREAERKARMDAIRQKLSEKK